MTCSANELLSFGMLAAFVAVGARAAWLQRKVAERIRTENPGLWSEFGTRMRWWASDGDPEDVECFLCVLSGSHRERLGESLVTEAARCQAWYFASILVLLLAGGTWATLNASLSFACFWKG